MKVTERVSSATATIWPTQSGFAVSDDCLRDAPFFYFRKNEEKKAVEKFRELSKPVTEKEFVKAVKFLHKKGA